ncbi:2-dehydro-3-deoxyphosphooctonate aldolase [Striga asiatica]|uniref:2-dehydro-3-deoxyphosphooctonate aldolase n=1 Tax=Striga asiatica TaxID=4170 RepID=A0A5A7P3Q3_STRAF|nr:2-dehydro-3-deoxyphosphooctonate aldolase [Striga asiatica]
MSPGLPLPQRVQVATWTVLHDKARKPVSLKMCIQSRQKRVIQQLQNLPLRLGPIKLVPTRERSLIHNLHSKQAPAHTQLRQIHAPNIPTPEPPQQLEMTHAQNSITGPYTKYSIPPRIISFVRLIRTSSRVTPVALVTNPTAAITRTAIVFIITHYPVTFIRAGAAIGNAHGPCHASAVDAAAEWAHVAARGKAVSVGSGGWLTPWNEVEPISSNESWLILNERTSGILVCREARRYGYDVQLMELADKQENQKSVFSLLLGLWVLLSCVHCDTCFEKRMETRVCQDEFTI